MWGKGDGGRLGFGHENPAFLPTLNPYLDSVSSVALGGLHSVALTSLGEVFTWSVFCPPTFGFLIIYFYFALFLNIDLNLAIIDEKKIALCYVSIG